MKSTPERTLVFVAGGTGFAPIKAMIEQQIQLNSQRKMELFWGLASAEDAYETDVLGHWKNGAPNLKITLAIEHGRLPKLPDGIDVFSGRLADAIENGKNQFVGADAYVAGNPAMMPGIMKALTVQGIASENIHIDSFGL